LTTVAAVSDAAEAATDVDPEREAATKAQVLAAAERLFAFNGFQNVFSARPRRRPARRRVRRILQA